MGLETRSGGSVLLVFNPGSANGTAARLKQTAIDRIGARIPIASQLRTTGDGADVARIASALCAERPEIVIAAGGDGTLHNVVQAVRAASLPEPPAVAIIPIGTANNVARSLGLQSLRRDGALDLAEQTLAARHERRIDLGLANGRCFVGSLAAGMDADILATRNRWRARLGMRGGYSLYLASCALNAFLPHGARASMTVDGAPPRPVRRLYNLLVLNTPIYAGEFRFAPDDPSGDGRLDLHLFTGAADYLGRYPAAWRRHVRYERGRAVSAPRRAQRFADLAVELVSPIAWQLDGEQMEATERLDVRVVAGGLRVIVPPGRGLPPSSSLG